MRWISDNMLFLKDGTMKLADFGLARMYGTPTFITASDYIVVQTCGASSRFDGIFLRGRYVERRMNLC
jgi:hypothetical protein